MSLDSLYAAVEKYNSYLTLGRPQAAPRCVLTIVYHAFKKDKKDKK